MFAAPFGKAISFNVNVTGAKPTSGTAPILVDGVSRGSYDFGAGAGSVTIPAGLDLPANPVVTIANVTQGGSVYSFTSDTVAITLDTKAGDPILCEAGCNLPAHNKDAEVCPDCKAVGPNPHIGVPCPNAKDLEGPKKCGSCFSIGLHVTVTCPNDGDLAAILIPSAIPCKRCFVPGAGFGGTLHGTIDCPDLSEGIVVSPACGKCGATSGNAHERATALGGASPIECPDKAIEYQKWECTVCGVSGETNPSKALHKYVNCPDKTTDLSADVCDDCEAVGPADHKDIVNCSEPSPLAGPVVCPGGVQIGTQLGTESYLVNGSANGSANLVGSTGTATKKEWTVRIPVSFKPEKGSAHAPNGTRFKFDYTVGTDSTYASTSYITGSFGGYGGGYYSNSRGYNSRRAPGSYYDRGYVA